MLVISRKNDEGIIIGDAIEVSVVVVLGNSAIVEVVANRDVQVEWKCGGRRKRAPETDSEQNFCIVLELRNTIHFNRRIEVTLVEVKNEKARLGVIAPRDVRIHRRSSEPPTEPN